MPAESGEAESHESEGAGFGDGGEAEHNTATIFDQGKAAGGSVEVGTVVTIKLVSNKNSF